MEFHSIPFVLNSEVYILNPASVQEGKNLLGLGSQFIEILYK